MFDPAKHSRQNTLDFKPPQPNPLIQWAFRAILPFIYKNVLHNLSMDLDETSQGRLTSIRGQRCLILPNHPAEWDPCVLFGVAKRLREHFFFVAAREVFDYSYGIRGWFFQKLGVYSLVRGSNDRKSLKTSMDILSHNTGRLVIFIEGEISNQNETLLPLESGVIQLGFMALNDVYKEQGKNLETLPSLFICPTSVRYVYDPNGLDHTVEHSLAALEKATGCAPQGGRYERIKTVATTVLTGTAEQFGCPLDPEATLVENVHHLSAFMLTKLEQIINVPPDNSLPHLDRIRHIRNTVDLILSEGMKDAETPYAKRLALHQKAVLRNFYQDLDRIVNFIAIYDGYLHPDMDPAQCVEILRRLEKEIFGKFRLVHPRTAHVRVAQPIDLKEHFPAFLEDKRVTVARLAKEVEHQLYQGILSIEDRGKSTSVEVSPQHPSLSV